jgi:hypothetical protein
VVEPHGGFHFHYVYPEDQRFDCPPLVWSYGSDGWVHRVVSALADRAAGLAS